ncbi:uncharacterized protein PV07_12549 [Cladophialophora immunda]|uniref:OTU domain-containing protein n=1 Tax=Cladophialophora immunda TaxID=569365 RepID=A0A0D2ABD3_9EURO|nr:uncharacterized protein PV07_12549 [Cladophialophora immunda]KIW22057.1 hypothetical protein PV07_12549 [Cladophialophora immunda]
MVRRSGARRPNLAERGLRVKKVPGDGNCLFAALSDKLCGSPICHTQIRATVVSHLRQNRQHFASFVEEDEPQRRRTLRSTTSAACQEPKDRFEKYLSSMSLSGTSGGHLELQAFCDAFARMVIVYDTSTKKSGGDEITERVFTPQVGDTAVVKSSLRIVFSGDGEKEGHYDSTQSENGGGEIEEPLHHSAYTRA